MILKCESAEEVRCCGVSIETVIGTKSVTSSIEIATEGGSITPEATTPTTPMPSSTTMNIESMTVSNESNITNTESNEQIETQTTSNDETSTTKQSGEELKMSGQSAEELTKMATTATVPTMQAVPTIREENVAVEGRNQGDGILSVFPNDNLTIADPSYVKIISNAPAMLVYAAKDDLLTGGDKDEINASTSSNLITNEESDIMAQTETPEGPSKSMVIEGAAPIDEDKEKNPSIEESMNDFRNKFSNDPTTATASESIDSSIDMSTKTGLSENTTKNGAINKVLETITILPQIDVNDLVSNESDSVVSSTESSSTTIAESMVTIPDLISTIETENTIPERHNKRRNSIYRGHSEPNTNELQITSSTTPLSHKLFKSKGFAGQNKTISNNETVNLAKNIESPKYIPKIADSVSNSNHVGPVLENEHKKQIVDVHSLLAMIRKQTGAEKSTISRSNSLQQLVANDKQQFKPILGNRHYQSIHRTTTPSPDLTSVAFETETQTKSNRKYQRRLPAKKFNINGKTTTTKPTKTTTTTESSVQKVTLSRNRFSIRRRQTTQTPETESTISSIKLTTTPTNEQSLEDEINVKVSLERRKKLFASRRRGGWSKVDTTTKSIATSEKSIETDASIEHESASMDVSSEKPIQKPYKIFSSHQRFNLKSSIPDADADAGTDSDAVPSIEETDS